VPGEEQEPGQLRQDAGEELDSCEVDLLRVGALFGAAIEAHTNSWFGLGHDLLSEASSPREWIQNGVASWIRCYQTQLDLYRGLCEVAGPTPEDDDDLFNGTVGADVFFTVDAFAEGTDPIPTAIPPGELGNVTVAPPAQFGNVIVASGAALAPHIRLTLSADGAGNKVVMVGLVGLSANPNPLPPGRRRATTLIWPGGSMRVIATRRRRRAV
jgi:hypothetical protein